MMGEETYREQIGRLIGAMSLPNREALLQRDLATESPLSRVKMFVDGNLDKRLDKVQRQLEFVAEVFDDFDRLLVEYIQSRPLAAYDTGASDGQRMLTWLAETKSLDGKQQDYVTCQQARHTVENLARKNRLKHVRFQELASLAQQHCAELETNRSLRVYINPIRTWARFVSSELLEGQTEPPVDVLFFAARDQVASCVLELEGQALINELADFQPCRLDDWSDWSSLADRQQLVELCHDLAQMGLIAFG